MSGMVVHLREKHDGELSGTPDARNAIRLWLRLLSCTMVVEKRVKRSLADQFATTLPRFDIMAALDRTETGLSLSALSQALLVSNGNITGPVQTLVRSGDVELMTVPGDRRTALVKLTDPGRARFRAMASVHHGWIEAMFDGLSKAETAQMLALLDTLKISIANAGPEKNA